MTKPAPDKTLALALLIRRAALHLAGLMEQFVRDVYGVSVDKTPPPPEPDLPEH